VPKSFTKRGLKDYLKLSGPATIIAIVGFLVMLNFLMPDGVFAADKEASGSGGVHKIVAELSDEQVRRLLIEELQRTGRHTEDEGTGLISKGFFSGMLARLENITGVLYWRITALQLNYVKIPHDIGKAVDYLTEGRGIVRFGQMLGILLLIFAAGFGIEKIIGKFTYDKSKWFEIVPSISGLAKFWGGCIKNPAQPDRYFNIFRLQPFYFFTVFWDRNFGNSTAFRCFNGRYRHGVANFFFFTHVLFSSVAGTASVAP